MAIFNRDSDDEVARGARAVVVHAETHGPERRDSEARLEEAGGLALAIGIDVRAAQAFRVRDRKPATLFGSGQVDQIATLVNQEEAELVIVDNALTPVQQSNLEKAVGAKVIDRTGLILEIFGERAATNEGRLQVELAHLDYQAGRLVRSWTHLERQRGGFGFLGGPGETQIEADRRMIRDRMAKIRKELDQVTRTRGLHRARRQRAPWPVIALVGYTNAGKSTLFNRLTGADVMAEDLLFATLDPTMRQIALPGLDKAILSDTVGFVSDLPTQLIAAFRATLEEVLSADLIVHVRDIAHPDSDAQRDDVLDVLSELGVAGEGALDRAQDEPAAPPIIEAWNKLDLLDPEAEALARETASRRDDVVILSALTGEGVADLQRAISTKMTAGAKVYGLRIAAADGAALAWLHEHGEVLSSDTQGEETRVEVRLSDAAFARFGKRGQG
ncbi:MAG: GTPase HflX [Sphingobium sp.]|jgi:GTP-binding protein HflX|uniref:GTPase HflX n=1 Tax=Sphingobium sp. TaxID=1912891 RepID=UPI000C57E2C9|nr:GTPase HflX [Sphingobium sp.]MBU0659273.1 GTPase HflX [Alphaproteobacteria bacterium]MBA4754504.1 GTPase HflX [Sphingobium sp.]MBS87306.1 GTPase HflX [Sphingobium sp.]MBS87822.1 GTPase HflX [Sphingobium sp.]MBU0775309.1 GTPase HflX [Alphaproteobacteria bacterium]